MEVVPVVNELRKVTEKLEGSRDDVIRLAKQRAKTEAIYRRELYMEKIRLHDEGMPVTLIEDVARGKLAKLKFDRDVSRELHRSAMASLSSMKVEIQSWQSILKYMSEVP